MTHRFYGALFLVTILLGACNEAAEKNTESEQSQEDTITTKTQEKETTTEATTISFLNKYIEETDRLENLKVLKKRYQNPAEGMAHDQDLYTIYQDGDEMVKLILTGGEMPYYSELSHYFKEGELQVVRQLDYYAEDPSMDGKLFNDIHIYFEKGLPFAIVGKTMPEDAEGTLQEVELKTTMLEDDSELVKSWTQQIKKLTQRIEEASIVE